VLKEEVAWSSLLRRQPLLPPSGGAPNMRSRHRSPRPRPASAGRPSAGLQALQNRARRAEVLTDKG
jgi:hypothetical protein